LGEVPSISPAFIQFGPPVWFWERQVNAFALQVEPKRFKNQDQATIDYAEALQVQTRGMVARLAMTRDEPDSPA